MTDKLLLDRDAKVNLLIAKDHVINKVVNIKVTKSNSEKEVKRIKYSFHNEKTFSKTITEFKITYLKLDTLQV